MNGYMPDFIFNVGATGAVLPAPGRYYIAVDSGRNPFTGTAARAAIHAPVVDQRRHAAGDQGADDAAATGRPSIVVKVADAKSGVDPLSLLLLYKNEQISARCVRPQDGRRGVPDPEGLAAALRRPRVHAHRGRPTSRRRRTSRTPGDEAMPNTRFLGTRFSVVARPVVTWIDADEGRVRAAQELSSSVAASSPPTISSVGFFDGKRQMARVRKSDAGDLPRDLAHRRRQEGPARADGHRLGHGRARGEALRRVRVCCS